MAETRRIGVHVVKSKCIGSALCADLLPEVFKLDAQGKAVAAGTADPSKLGKLMDAAVGCPVRAIRLANPPGKRLFP